MPITSSAAKSWQKDDSENPDEAKKFAPERAYDEDYTTTYASKDDDTDGNFLKLYLPKKYKIDSVKVTNRGAKCCNDRIVGTVVKVYFTEGEKESMVSKCGDTIQG